METQKFLNCNDLQPERLIEPPEKVRRTPSDARPLECENTGFNGLTLTQSPESKPVLIQACCVPPNHEGPRSCILFEPGCGGLALTPEIAAELLPQFHGLPSHRLKVRCRRCKTRVWQFPNPNPDSSWRHAWLCHCIIGWGTGPLTRRYWTATVAAVCAIGFVVAGHDVTPGTEVGGAFGKN
jgi:hypothetical protein